ncbi:sialidase family protein [Niameybacter massiliensis]|uniref:exo-alpha-sialidase n=1 Tax=Holtiella tumoricola TaxID=3018743 RepID=A0AA42IYC3_9FIRM|nr:sialidase family protein [Holtiella tumoricola]MDA3729964.1 sialidase family protein [Holtiella tumoricola]
MFAQNVLPQSIVFEHNQDFNSNYFRIPFMTITKKGTLIAGSDIRYVDASDYNMIDIGIARSEDGGKTWIDKQIVHHRRGIHPEHSRKMDGCIVVDHVTGRIFLFALALDLHMHLDSHNHKMQDLVYAYSDDDGKTWSEEISLKKFYDDDCNLFLQGPGNGIQLEDGTLVIPIQRWVPPNTNIRSTAGIVYSTDHGETWHQGETRIDTYTSESSVVEYKSNQILMSCRAPLTDARAFYTTSDLGKTWVPHISNNTIYERGGCQSPILKFTAPNHKTYGVYATPQHSGISWERNKLTLMATDDFIHWNTIAEVIHDSNDGYSCFTYDETNQALYLLTEQRGNIVCHNLSCYLPAIMQNHTTYDHQAISKVHRFPVYSMGHYLNMTHQDEWYKLLTLKLKANSFALLNLNVLGFHHNDTIILRAKQHNTDAHDLEHIEVTSTLPLQLVPTLKEDDYFVYELYLQATTLDTLSLAVQNCMISDLEQAVLQITTTFQDATLESSLETLPTTN